MMGLRAARINGFRQFRHVGQVRVSDNPNLTHSDSNVTIGFFFKRGLVMGFTDKFRVQHNDILKLAGEITGELNASADAAKVRKLLSNMAGKINFHLAMEDKALYPRLLEQKDTQVNALATRFMKEMGGLGEVFTAYNSKWQVSAIRANPSQFTDETRQVFAALTNRIARENRELYPLADRDA